MSDAVRALGTVLKVGATTPVTVAGLTSIGGLELSADSIDVTTLDSTGGYREFIAGFKDAGEVSVEGFFIPGTGKGQTELYTLFESGNTEEFFIEFPNDAAWDFEGVVTGFSTSAELEVSGQPTLTVGTGGSG